ncbi:MULTISPECIES: DUF1284 domain-containing protein [Acidobacterium]|uniref:DUF1284 domain-containing protein n=1 Tax=Acidobacterium capsulatum (strain ATCC 51196 / DSM 11244 / BCRC 80197 / JCM 7670 / NBRC 15755 / NCIMB 13165 / 161) TaxID=240015 RepID=C1F8Z7_ACIC5|nr:MULTISPECIES: DUF1284 domain-containing protein [Acidobacterium]ACO32290.1 conserved hypothetical protein [Acidobacterium capsulatum ATCC 51196]HCT62121.1 DUF1284 domain-containing protein [Acidobacterium sp.]
MIRLRPHHLLCMLTYAGNGYSAPFVANFDALARRIADGRQTVEITSGHDDICAPLVCGPDGHCTGASVRERDRLASEDVSSLLGLQVVPGLQIVLSAERLAGLRAAFASGRVRRACEGCQWKPLCDGIAQQGFAGTRLLESLVARPEDTRRSG